MDSDVVCISMLPTPNDKDTTTNHKHNMIYVDRLFCFILYFSHIPILGMSDHIARSTSLLGPLLMPRVLTDADLMTTFCSFSLFVLCSLFSGLLLFVYVFAALMV